MTGTRAVGTPQEKLGTRLRQKCWSSISRNRVLNGSICYVQMLLETIELLLDYDLCVLTHQKMLCVYSCPIFRDLLQDTALFMPLVVGHIDVR